MFKRLAFDCGNAALSAPQVMEDNEPKQDYTLSSFLLPQIPWYQQAYGEAFTLLDLPDNWDSYGASKISTFKVATGLSFICSVSSSNTPKPTIVPTSKGGIQFEWHTRNIDLEVEFISMASAHVYFNDNFNPEDEWEGKVSYDFTKLNTYIDKISK